MRLPPVFVISLVRLSNRRRKLKKMLKESGFSDVTWVEAVDGHAMSPNPPFEADGLDAAMPWPSWVDPYSRRAMTLGEVGCALSHVRVWQQIAANGVPAIVLEDDALPVSEVIDSLPLLLHDLSFVDFDLVYLAQRNTPPPKMLAGRYIHTVDYHPLWTLAYLLSAEGANGLLNSAWRTHLCPSDELLPAAFGLNDKESVNEKFHAITGRVLSSNQRFFTPQDGSESSETEKSKPINDPSVDLRVFTVASDRTPELERLVASGPRYGADIEVLGLDKPWKGGDMNSPGGGQKVNLLRPALKDVPDEQPVLFVDGYDTIITRHVADMLMTWQDKFDRAPVFAAEVTCWPDPERASDFPAMDDDNPYRFLNSGVFLAQAGDLKKILAGKIADADDDQRYYTDRFLAQGKAKMPKTIHLDVTCSLFQCLNGSLDDVIVDQGRGMIQNKRFESWPAVVHANGPTKPWLEEDGRAVGGRWRNYYGEMPE